jgi:hypothetical protein
MTASWRTSLAGLGTILAAVGVAVTALTDGDPATIPDWGIVITAVIAGIGLFLARDNNVSSESAGAK